MSSTLRVVMASPLPVRLRPLITTVSPTVELLTPDDLLPPQAHPGHHPVANEVHRTPQQQRDFDELLTTADVWYGLPDNDPALTGRLVPRSPRLRWVHAMAAGGGAQVRAAGLSAADLARVVFTTSAGVHGTALAEFAVFGILAGAKDLPLLRTAQAEHHWGARWIMRPVHGQTVLVLGLGAIGTETARLASALGARVLGVRRHPAPVPWVDEVHPISSLPALLPRADAVVVTLPGTAETERLLDAPMFAAMKPGTVLINVGRGSVIDETALLQALDDGIVRSAVLDVTATEPLPADSPLWSHPAVLISPHTAALQADEDDRIAALFAENLSALLAGRPLRNVVTPGLFY